MTTQTRLVTAEDLLAISSGEFRYELVKGILTKMSPSGTKHGKTAARLLAPLEYHVRANHLGQVYAAETGFKIASNPDTVRAPDVAFVSQSRLERIGDIEGFFPGAPDLAIEVVSPSDSYAEVEEKVLEWLEAGTQMAVVANSRKRILTVFRSFTDIKVLTEADSLVGENVVPGFVLPVKGLFD
jgi:Uma2 family endonuclease